MENSNQKFQVEIETGEIMSAELLSVVEIDSKEYAVYSLDNDNGTVDILASYVIKDAEGYDQLVDITNPIDKEKISNFIRGLVA
ncbi:MAG TPA: hypothetical protein DCE23_09335 [Firmicutes bacterium]|nr:hypothetical protein [Bacillota bacterium]